MIIIFVRVISRAILALNCQLFLLLLSFQIRISLYVPLFHVRIDLQKNLCIKKKKKKERLIFIELAHSIN